MDYFRKILTGPQQGQTPSGAETVCWFCRQPFDTISAYDLDWVATEFLQLSVVFGFFAPLPVCPLALSPLAHSPLACSPFGLFAPWLIRPLTLDDSPPLKAKGYQPVHRSLPYKLLCCTLFRLNSRYLKQNLRFFCCFKTIFLTLSATVSSAN